MKRWLSILAAAGLLLFPIAANAADTESQTSPEKTPPVAQTLVREGDFAIKLATDLNVGKPTDEATAEDLLATAGIAPVNGWISDYPVTPQIISQLDDSIAKAAADGKISMSAEGATRQVHEIVAALNLPEPAGKEAASSAAAAAPENPAIVNNYYYSEGPPIVTYYAPPVDYAYLYDWVPYPVFWFGFWFPGFFICHNFTTTVVVHPFLSVNRTFVTSRVVVSNRFIDPVTRHVVRVDPVLRINTGAVRPMTVLRAGSSRSFMTVADMRHGSVLHGISPVRTGSDFRRSGAFGSPEMRRSANSILSRSIQGMNSRHGFVQGNRRPGRQMSPGGTDRSRGSTMMRGTGGHAAPGRNFRNFAGPGVARPAGPVRSFNGPARSTPGSAPWFANHGHWRG